MAAKAQKTAPKPDFERDVKTRLEIILANQIEYKEKLTTEMSIDKIIEEKMFEVKAATYAVLIITAIMLALALGAIVKITLG